ncbi:MAG: tetratricopeptide repeat protein, partial [Acidobacteria bacterium]
MRLCPLRGQKETRLKNEFAAVSVFLLLTLSDSVSHGQDTAEPEKQLHFEYRTHETRDPAQASEEIREGTTSVVSIAACKAAVRPESANAALGYLRQGSARYGKGDLDGAIRQYSSAIKQDPCLALAYNNRGN